MKNNFTTLLLLFCFLVGSINSQAQEIKVSLDTNAINIGEEVKYSIEINGPKNAILLFETPEDTLTRFIEINETSEIDTLGSENGVLYTLSFTITSFDSGQHIIPPFKALLINNKDSIHLLSQALVLNAMSPDVNPKDGFKEITDIYKEPITLTEILIGVGGLLGLIALFFVGRWLVKARQEGYKGFIPRKKLIIRPANEVAIEALDVLDKKQLWQKGDFRLYYSELSMILRTYLKQYYGFEATEMVTFEILNSFREKNSSEDLSMKLKNLLEMADMSKYAKATPGEYENRNALSLGREIIHATFIVETETEETEE